MLVAPTDTVIRFQIFQIGISKVAAENTKIGKFDCNLTLNETDYYNNIFPKMNIEQVYLFLSI